MKHTFQRHTTVPAYTRDPITQDMPKWSADFDVPLIGEDVIIRINGIGHQGGWLRLTEQDLGVMTVPYSPPDWWIRQNGPPSPDNAALAFGAEISLAVPGEGS